MVLPQQGGNRCEEGLSGDSGEKSSGNAGGMSSGAASNPYNAGDSESVFSYDVKQRPSGLFLVIKSIVVS